MSKAAEAIVRSFVERINAHDPEGLLALCSSDHVFIDSLGNTLTGYEALLHAWRGYFARFPDYRVEITTVFSTGHHVAAFGKASGTLAGASAASHSSWTIPAAWLAAIKDGRISSWQVYADNKPVYEILSRGIT